MSTFSIQLPNIRTKCSFAPLLLVFLLQEKNTASYHKLAKTESPSKPQSSYRPLTYPVLAFAGADVSSGIPNVCHHGALPFARCAFTLLGVDTTDPLASFLRMHNDATHYFMGFSGVYQCDRKAGCLQRLFKAYKMCLCARSRCQVVASIPTR